MFEVYLASCYSTDFDLDLIPHHIDYYVNMGIKPENFLIVLHNRVYPENLQQAYKMCAEKNVFPKLIWRDEFNAKEKIIRNISIMREHTRPAEWIVHAETDEFHEYDIPLMDLIMYLGNNDKGGVQGVFIDRVAKDGELKKVELSPSIFEQFPIKCYSRSITNIIGTSKHDHKVMIYRSGLTPSNGVHDIYGSMQPKYYQNIQKVHHFRWNSTTIEKYKRRNKYTDNNGTATSILSHLSENDGRLSLSEVNIII